jgi:molybdenum cofactor biosynthesis enzyme
MRDISHKQITLRTARAVGIIFCSEASIDLINSNKLHHTPYIVGNVIVVDRKDLEFVGKTLERKEISASIQIQG